MSSHSLSRGSAAGGAPLLLGAALALVIWPASVPARAAAAASHVPRPAGRARELPLGFEGLAWDASPRAVAGALAARGFRPVAADEGGRPTWHGHASGSAADLTPEFDASSRLLAVTLRFAPGTRGSPMQRYAELVDAVRRRHGAWIAQVEPGRPVTEERRGRLGITRRLGSRTAATLWTDAAGAAAAVQLDGDGVLWIRYESPRWNDATGPDGAAR